jgi:hypothetical protein
MNEELTIHKAVAEVGLEKSKAEQIESTFMPMVEMLKSFESSFNELSVIGEGEITEDVCRRAKRLRHDISKVRIDTGKLKDKQKEYIKLEDKAIMGVHNIIVWAVKEKEDKLKEIENYFETKERERVENLQREREFELENYGVDGSNIDLGNMQEDVYKNFLIGSKTNYENKIKAEQEAEKARIAAEKKAEEERVAREKAAEEERQRIRKENERLKQEAEKREAQIKKERAEAQKKQQEVEAQLKKDREEADRKQQEIRRQEAEKQRKIEDQLKKEAEDRARLEREIEASKEKERVAREKEEEEKQARLQANDVDKIKQLISDINHIERPEVQAVKMKKLIAHADRVLLELSEQLIIGLK